MLKIGGYINILIGVLHFVALFWADVVFAYTGVAKEMQEMADVYPALPTIITIITGVIFIIFGLYGLSAAGVIRRLPLLKLGVFTIAAIYIIRAAAGYITPSLVSDARASDQFIFSCIALIVGLLYLVGGLKKWVYTK